MSICPKNKSSKARRDKRRANDTLCGGKILSYDKIAEATIKKRLSLLQQNNCDGLAVYR